LRAACRPIARIARSCAARPVPTRRDARSCAFTERRRERFNASFAGSHQLQLTNPEGGSVITLGVILLIIGFIAKIAILWTIGVILLVIGLILAVLGMMGRAVGGRAHYY